MLPSTRVWRQRAWTALWLGTALALSGPARAQVQNLRQDPRCVATEITVVRAVRPMSLRSSDFQAPVWTVEFTLQAAEEVGTGCWGAVSPNASGASSRASSTLDAGAGRGRRARLTLAFDDPRAPLTEGRTLQVEFGCRGPADREGRFPTATGSFAISNWRQIASDRDPLETNWSSGLWLTRQDGGRAASLAPGRLTHAEAARAYLDARERPDARTDAGTRAAPPDLPACPEASAVVEAGESRWALTDAGLVRCRPGPPTLPDNAGWLDAPRPSL